MLRFILCLGLLPTLLAGATTEPREFVLPAAAAEIALETFAEQAAAQVVYLLDDVRGVMTHPIAGRFPPGEALGRMLAGTALKAEQDAGTGAYIVRRTRPGANRAESAATPNPDPSAMKSNRLTTFTAALLATLSFTSADAATPAPPTEGETVTMTPFEVTAAVGYASTNTSSGTRIRADLKDIPFAVGIVTSDFIKDFLALNDYKDSLAFTSGVSSRGNYNQAYYVRGLQNDGQLRNGFFRAGMFDAVNVDRIEVIKGPNAGIYGRASPGGAINVVTKMPTSRPTSYVTATLGANEFQRFEVGGSGPLLGQRLLVRVDAARQSEQFYYDREDFRQETVSAVLRYQFSSGARLTLEGDWLDKLQSAPEGRTLFRRVGGVITGQLAEELRGFNSQAGESFLNRQLKAGNLTFEQNFGRSVQFRATAHASQRMDPSWRTGGDTFYTVETRTVANRRTDLQEGGTKYVAFQSDLLFDFATGPLTHKLLATYDYARDTSRDERWRVATADLNNPAFNIPVLSLDAPNFFMAGDKARLRDFYRNDTSRDVTHAVFVSNRTYFVEKRGLLLAGVRQNWVHSTSLNYFNGATTDQNRKATTGQLGLNWKVDESLTAYANYSTSFRVNGGVDLAGRPWDNQKGKGGEVGLKAEWLNRKLSFSTAYFDITRFNVLRTNAVTRLQELTGEENSKGFEVDMHYQVTRAWLLFGQYTNLRARITRDFQDATLEGFQLPFVPDVSYGLATRYEFKEGPLQGVFVTLGLKHVGEITTSTSSTAYQRNYRQAAYSQVDGSVGYGWKTGNRLHHRVALNAKNLLDEDYYFGDRVRGLGLAAYFGYTLTFR